MTSINQKLFEIGKIPPHALDLEEAVIGATMLDNDILHTIMGILQPKSFYKESHERIFTCIVNLFNRQEIVDILTVTNELKKTGELEMVGGAYYIVQLCNRVGSAANAEFHARIIAQAFMQRELIRVSTSIIQDCYNTTTDVFDTIGYLEKSLTDIIGGIQGKSYTHISENVSKVLKKYSESDKKNITGVPSGIDDLDRKTGGWQDSDVIILAARPGMGKTSFALSAAKTSAESGDPVAIFSLEMSDVQLTARMIAQESGYSVEKINRKMLESDEIPKFEMSANKIASLPIYIDDSSSLGIRELRSKASKLKREHNIKLIIIDYIQLCNDDGLSKGNREQEISRISRAIKSIAKDLNVPIIALSQLSRQVEARPSKEPMLSDLRESGSIEADADLVMFIYRPEYYGFTEDDGGNSTAGVAKIIIAKHRNGGLGDILCRFVHRSTMFANIN